VPIPESQLDTWAKLGSVTQSAETYATIKKVLEASGTSYSGRDSDSFLQGSYGNDTNIRADSDVDILMRLKSAFESDIKKLPQDQARAWDAAYANATYGVPEFKKEVLSVLVKEFGSDVELGTKAIRIKARNNRRSADVLVAGQFRRYTRFTSLSDQDYEKGVVFLLPDGTRIDNFPKQHSANCTAKHQATGTFFKPMVRIIKNMRNCMIERGMISKGLAPSYYLEGLLYNLPNNHFVVSFANTLDNALEFFAAADRSEFVCANELYHLLREGSPVTWRATACEQFLSAATKLWNNWS
jgi:hypothetical protein